ncbi:MAG: hypothetical protein EP343_14805 [Deltaproteobacteria bacterium]|nr:MAG: hypothetical protein EP343_14805 [Deltaproteobacteria bacterium]
MRSFLFISGLLVTMLLVLSCSSNTLPADPCDEYPDLCKAGQRCYIGDCYAACGVGESECGRVCANLMTNRFHCGACKNPCKAGEICKEGLCKPDCPPTLPICRPPPRP